MIRSSDFICKHCSQCHLSLSALRQQLNLENKLRFFLHGPLGKADGSKTKIINITQGFITFNAFERFLGLFAVWLALLFKIPKLTLSDSDDDVFKPVSQVSCVIVTQSPLHEGFEFICYLLHTCFHWVL